MNSENIQKLKIYVVKCHTDKALNEIPPRSKYEIDIQAGAALTDKRICDTNDHDGFPDSLSGRNMRYSEATAMYWIYRHIKDEEYIGIAHYRRRLKMSDNELEQYMNRGIDLITTNPITMNCSIREGHCTLNYAYDWEVFMDILKETEPEEYNFDHAIFEDRLFHPGNINIFRSELYKAFSDWCFPILNEFYKRVPEKTDIYRKRDVGFIAESLSHLFVMKLIRDGKKVVEVPLLQLKSNNWIREEACDYNNPDTVIDTCNSLYKQGKILQCSQIISYYETNRYPKDMRITKISQILFVSQEEQRVLPQTMHDYLPKAFRSDIYTLTYTWTALEKAVKTHLSFNNIESSDILRDFLDLTHFSDIAVSIAAGIVTG